MSAPQPADLRGQPVLVLGLGSFGGGAGCARALARLGAEVTVTDLRGAEELPEAMATLRGLPIRFALGGHPEELFHGQWVVVNPAVPAESPALAHARRHGCRLTTELDLGLRSLRDRPALAVTGTHGKSTCAALAAHLLAGSDGGAVLAGNLGGSLLDAAEQVPAEAALVVELSSFQLERLEAPRGWPRVAVVTSLGDDHLDRHRTREAYWGAKRRLCASQDVEGTLLLPCSLPDAPRWQDAARGRVLWLGSDGLPDGADGFLRRDGAIWERRDGRERALATDAVLPFREPYRMPSLLGAVAGASLLGLPAEAIPERLRSWGGLPHRMQPLVERNRRIVVDNGVATHPDPTIAALEAMEGPCVLCAGGYDKGLPLEPLAEAARHCRVVHLSGPGGRRLARLLASAGVAHVEHPCSQDAMSAALTGLRPGETLLYSPCFSSYDEFRNFRDRATLFQELCLNFTSTSENPWGDAVFEAY